MSEHGCETVLKDTGQISTGWWRRWRKNKKGSTLPWQQVFSEWSWKVRAAPSLAPWRTDLWHGVSETPGTRSTEVQVIKTWLSRYCCSCYNGLLSWRSENHMINLVFFCLNLIFRSRRFMFVNVNLSLHLCLRGKRNEIKSMLDVHKNK